MILKSPPSVFKDLLALVKTVMKWRWHIHQRNWFLTIIFKWHETKCLKPVLFLCLSLEFPQKAGNTYHDILGVTLAIPVFCHHFRWCSLRWRRPVTRPLGAILVIDSLCVVPEQDDGNSAGWKRRNCPSWSSCAHEGDLRASQVLVSSCTFYLRHTQNCQDSGRVKDTGSNPESSCSVFGLPLLNRVSGAIGCGVLILLTFDLAWERNMSTCRYNFYVL